MDKKELIDRIGEINKSAKIEFLTRFSEEDLTAYLEHLLELDPEELVVVGESGSAMSRRKVMSGASPSRSGAGSVRF